MSDGGVLLIRTKLSTHESIEISFEDHGIGIPYENLDKIFEPLFTTKAKGIGLGLPIAKIMIEAHSGTIDVQSEIGKGSIFTIELPIKKNKVN